MSFEEEGANDRGEHKYEEGPLSKGNMKCTDVGWLIAYCVFQLGGLLIFYQAYIHGDVARLMRATDYNGDVCGKNGTAMEARPLGYYPRLPEDVLVALGDGSCVVDELTGELGDCSVGLYTICVAKCPKMGDIVCDYDVEPQVLSPKSASLERKTDAALRRKCWTVPIAQEEKFNRCVPALDQQASSVSYRCCYDRVTTAQWEPGRAAPDGPCPGAI
jgi:hypothetical protein